MSWSSSKTCPCSRLITLRCCQVRAVESDHINQLYFFELIYLINAIKNNTVVLINCMASQLTQNMQQEPFFDILSVQKYQRPKDLAYRKVKKVVDQPKIQLPFSYAKSFGLWYFQTLNMSMNDSYCIFQVSWEVMQLISTSEFSKSDLRSYQSPVMRHKLQVPSLLCPDSTVKNINVENLPIKFKCFIFSLAIKIQL